MKRLTLILMAIALSWLAAYASRAETASFVVTAYNTWGESGYSQEISCDMTTQKAMATLKWNTVPGATGYRLYYRPPWQTGFIAARSVDVGDAVTAMVYAVDIFKLNSADIPVVVIQCED